MSVRVSVVDSGFLFTHPSEDLSAVDVASSVNHLSPGSNLSAWSDGVDHGYATLGAMMNKRWLGAREYAEADWELPDSVRIELHNTGFMWSHIESAILASLDTDVINISIQETTPWSNGAGVNWFSGMRTAMERAVDEGRDGLGSTIVMAAGNNRQDNHESNVSLLANNRHVIAVGNSDRFDESYNSSSIGDNLLTSALGRFNQVFDDTTTGYANWTGTSFAAPEVSTLTAMMLEEAPDLGWRDIIQIVALSSRDPIEGASDMTTHRANGAAGWNGGGLTFSREYGFGIADLENAMALARTWTPGRGSTNEIADSAGWTGNQTITGSGAVRTLTSSEAIKIDYANLYVDINHGDWTDLHIQLTSPSGTVSDLAINTGVAGKGGVLRYDLGSRRFLGEDAAGEWTVRVMDTKNGARTGTLREVRLDVTGSASSDDDIHVYSDDYADNWSEARAEFTDAVGVNTLNFAMTTGGVDVDLTGATAGSIGGAAFSVTADAAVSEVVLGAGDDSVTGTDGDDVVRLYGGGADSIDGGGGNDRIVFNGSVGDYMLRWASDASLGFWSAAESVVSWAVEVFEFADTVLDAATAALSARFFVGGGAETDSLSGTGGADELRGEAGDDVLAGGAGDDYLHGGDGDDAVSYAGAAAAVSLKDGGVWKGDGGHDTLVSIERIVGSDFDDAFYADGAGVGAIEAGAGDDRFFANGQAISFDGGAGDDYVAAGTGGGVIAGGEGVDTLDYRHVTGTVVIKDGEARGAVDNQLISGFEVIRATASDDWVVVGDGGVKVFSGSGADVVMGGAGLDILVGGAGDDILRATDFGETASTERDGLYGGAGDDEMFGSDGRNRLLGDVGDDAMHGEGGDDVMFGDAGDDVLHGGAGDDYLHAGAGSNSINGGAGKDQIDYRWMSTAITVDGASVSHASGTDTLSGVERIRATELADSIEVVSTGMIVNAHGGDDTVTGGTGFDIFYGGAGNDVLRATDVASVAVEVAQGDRLFGGDGDDELHGGAGGDYLRGDAGDDIAYGYGGDDRFMAGTGDDTLEGGAGNDALVFWGADGGVTVDLPGGGDAWDFRAVSGSNSWTAVDVEFIYGSHFDDVLHANDLGMRLVGEGGDDMVVGGVGSDVLMGGVGQDVLFGGVGDVLRGDTHRDLLMAESAGVDLGGGSGDDVLVVRSGTHHSVRGDGGTDVIALLGEGAFAFTDGDGAENEMFLGDGVGAGDVQLLQLGGGHAGRYAILGVDAIEFAVSFAPIEGLVLKQSWDAMDAALQADADQGALGVAIAKGDAQAEAWGGGATDVTAAVGEIHRLTFSAGDVAFDIFTDAQSLRFGDDDPLLIDVI